MNTRNQECRKLDMSKLTNRITKFASTEDALREVTPISWSEEVLRGGKKVILTKEK